MSVDGGFGMNLNVMTVNLPSFNFVFLMRTDQRICTDKKLAPMHRLCGKVTALSQILFVIGRGFVLRSTD